LFVCINFLVTVSCVDFCFFLRSDFVFHANAEREVTPDSKSPKNEVHQHVSEA
jgi:hypothetical protein